MSNTIIEVRDLSKEFDGEVVVNYINFNVAEGEFVTLLGPSGCGKTTILRMIAGFETPTSGDIYLYGKKINDAAPNERPVNTVFQNYALFPHMNVFNNIAFSLAIKKLPKKQIEEKVNYYLDVVNLSGYGSRDVSSLSGGQQQRVAIARALANEPKVLLLDEPLSALDLKLRKEMQQELKRIQKEVQITFIYVTHDQEEALSLSDKIIVMRKGEILQIGSPIDIYDEPINSYVADFIGESNIIDAVMHKNYEVEFLGKKFKCVDKKFPETTSVKVVIRPEDIEFSSLENAQLTGTIISSTFKGVHYEYKADIGEMEFLVQSTVEKSPGDIVGLSFVPNAIHIMRAEQRNIISSKMKQDNVVSFLGADFECEHEIAGQSQDVLAVIKPADWIILDKADKSAKLEAVIQYSSYHSERYECVAKIGDFTILLESITALKPGDRVGLDVDSDDIMIILDEEDLIEMDQEMDEEEWED
ncbi:MAG: ABC transporter ATP-binding protein [Eubacteriaceae bacterium]|nr:ABC transporter ATP-binding protein [Eubacteriaceae bacterium]